MSEYFGAYLTEDEGKQAFWADKYNAASGAIVCSDHAVYSISSSSFKGLARRMVECFGMPENFSIVGKVREMPSGATVISCSSGVKIVSQPLDAKQLCELVLEIERLKAEKAKPLQ